MPHRWTFVLGGLLLILSPGRAQEDAPPPPDFSPLDQLCAPIALYPDPVVSLVLPAATFPDQIQAAATGGPPPGNWDASVVALTHYPSVLQWMASNPDWTAQVGGAFASDPGSVMDAIQDLRHRAQASGILVSTPQQQVVADEGGAIEIVPAQPTMIYVPEYDPALVFWGHVGGYHDYFYWGNPYPAGDWLTFDFDWRSHRVWTGNWYGYRMAHGGWRQPIDHAHISGGAYHGWHPPAHPPARPSFVGGHGNPAHGASRPAVAQPHPMRGAPHPGGPLPHPGNAPAHRNAPVHQNAPDHRPAASTHASQPAPGHPQPAHSVAHEAPVQHAPAHPAPPPPVAHQPAPTHPESHASSHERQQAHPTAPHAAGKASPAKRAPPKPAAPKPPPPPPPQQQDGHQNP